MKFYAAQIVLAVDHLHRQNIVHRDLKLENVMLDADGYVKVIDFGLAKMLRGQQQTSTFVGTPEYLAPEMVEQKGHGKEVDYWAVGVLM